MEYIEATTEQEKKIIECAQALIQAVVDANLPIYYSEHSLSHFDIYLFDFSPDKITVQCVLNDWSLRGDRNADRHTNTTVIAPKLD
jgi:hypothetical protein